MEIMITEKDENYVEMTCGKKVVCVSTMLPGQVRIVVLGNGSFSPNRLGYGKQFSSFEQAIENYKSKEVKAAIAAARLELIESN